MKEGLIHGQGIFSYANSKYEGGFAYGDKHGKGKLTEERLRGKEVVTHGTWKNDLLDGIVTIIDGETTEDVFFKEGQEMIFGNNPLVQN